MRILSTSVALAVFSAAMWFAWLGWDHEYHLADGVPQGPYRAWQVVGCALSIVVAAVVAYGAVRRVSAVVPLPLAGTLGFALPWAVDAARTDESGLWVVGLVLLLAGGFVGLLVVTAVASAFLRPRVTGFAVPPAPAGR